MEYATRLMVALARSYKKATLSADKLSESESVPVDYVNQILLRLKRAGLVESYRGTTGGYALSRDPATVTLAQVIRAVDGRIFEEVCEKYDAGNRDCHHQARCSISPIWQRLGSLIEDYFNGITLAKILAEAPVGCGKWADLAGKVAAGK